MIELKIASDLHLEHIRGPFPDFGTGEVLILAGDILQYNVSTETFEKYIQFFDEISKNFNIVFVVAGNHEFYQGRFPDVYNDLKSLYSRWPNIHFLQNNYYDYRHIRFIGATLWTDFNKGNPLVKFEIKRAMNDYRLIKLPAQNYRKLYPEYVYNEHQKTLDYIRQNIADNSVIITHHAPSSLSIDEKYKYDYPMNYGYFSDLEDFILKYNPQMWIHGHMHSCSHYNIGDTRIIANPLGYPGENPLFNIERKVYV